MLNSGCSVRVPFTCIALSLAPALAQAIGLQSGTASFTQTACGSHSPDHVYDGVTTGETGWSIAVHCGPPGDAAVANIAAFETAVDVNATQLQFLLTQGPTQHLIGRFRLSVTTDDRATFCDGLDNGGDVSANWTVLGSPVVTSGDAVTFTVLPDHSILVAGSASSAVYDVRYTGSFLGITGIRLEVLEDPSLPFGGPGMQPTNGNFNLLEMDVIASGGAPPGSGPRDVELFDMDGDGDLDVATANETSANIGMQANNGLGVLAAAVTVALTPADMGPGALAAGDLDGDGARDDLVVVCHDSSTAVFVIDPAGATNRTSFATGGLRPTCVACGDLDANPIDDVVIGRRGELLAGGGGLSLVRNGGAPIDLVVPAPHSTVVTKVALGDLDGDGDLDLAALTAGGPDTILLFAGDGTGNLAFSGALALASSGFAAAMTLVDIDGDQRNDLVVLQPQLIPPAQTVRIFRRVAAGTLSTALFTTSGDFATAGAFATDVAAGDFDDDSITGHLARIDLVHADAGTGTLTVRSGFTGSGFLGTAGPTVGTNPVAVAVGDLDGDGSDDIAVANQGSDDVTIVITTQPALAQPYGTGCGGPAIAAVGVPLLGNPAFGVRVDGGAPGAPALLLYSHAADDLSLAPSSCRLLLAAPLVSLLSFTGQSGSSTYSFAVPALPALRGMDLFFQYAVIRSPGGAFADLADLSNALRLQIGS